jgi:hypothetical protein
MQYDTAIWEGAWSPRGGIMISFAMKRNIYRFDVLEAIQRKAF